MAFIHPKIIYNASTGSNSNSGTNAPSTPITNTTTSQTVTATGGSNTITFSAAVDLTGINNDGTDIIYVNHGLTAADDVYLFQIVSITGTVNACTALTVEAKVGAAGFTAAGWSIGGIRQTPEGNGAYSDFYWARPGWVYEFQSGTYSQVTADWRIGIVDNASVLNNDLFTYIRAAAGADVTIEPKAVLPGGDPFIRGPGSVYHWGLRVEGIKFDASNCTSIGTNVECFFIDSIAIFINCEFINWYSGSNDIAAIDAGANGDFLTYIENCVFRNCYYGYKTTGVSGESYVIRYCKFYSDTVASPEMSVAIYHQMPQNRATIQYCTITNFQEAAIWYEEGTQDTRNTGYLILNNTIDGCDNTGSRVGLKMSRDSRTTDYTKERMGVSIIENNVITRCGTGIALRPGTGPTDDVALQFVRNNAFYDNTTNIDYTSTSYAANDVNTAFDVTTDPLFVNNTTGAVADYDYSLQSESPLINAGRNNPII